MMEKLAGVEASLLFPSLPNVYSTLPAASSILVTTTPATRQRPRTTEPVAATPQLSRHYGKPADAPAEFTERTTSPSRVGLQAPTTLLAAMTAALLVPMAEAHEHHGEEKFPDGMTTSGEPIDTILWIHIFIQMLAYGIIFPVGMVLGMIRSRFHVPLQIVGSLLALLGALLGHAHKGRQFVGHNVHAAFATPLQFLLLTQIVLGLYLKMHLERGINGKIRPVIRVAHGVVGKAMPVLAWTQMLFGGITALGFCQDDHFGQCLAHFIMGSAFMAYAAIMTILLLVGQVWLRRTGRSQEFFDSAVIAAWGCVNTFTEHRWGSAWAKNDWQHTTMGIIWWCAGLAGVWLSKDREGRPKRNFVPGLVLILTGWGMSGHPQELMVSEAVHKVFGYSLMAAGLSRIIEVSFVCKDGYEPPNGEINSFQYIPIYFLFASGFLFMGATEEQMDLVANSGMDHVSYILILYSLAFLMFLFVNMLVSGYDRAMNPIAPGPGHQRVPVRSSRISMSRGEERQLRAAEEFALDDLMSDDDEEAGLVRARRKEEELERDSDDQRRGLGSPSSTLGGNSEGVAR